MKTAFRFLSIFAALTCLLFSACEPTDGDTTGDDPRDPYIGEWQFVESLKSTEGQSYVVNITKDPDNSSQIILGNFGNPGSSSVSATGLVTSSQVVISSQKMSNNWTVVGSGHFTNLGKTTMSWSFSILAGGNLDPYTAVATKQ